MRFGVFIATGVSSAPGARLRDGYKAQQLQQRVRTTLRRPRRTRHKSCSAQLNDTPSESSSTPTTSEALRRGASAATSLDAATTAFTKLRGSLPFVTAEDLVADDMRYDFGNGLVSLRGKSAYSATQRHWCRHVPETLGRQWKVRSEGEFDA